MFCFLSLLTLTPYINIIIILSGASLNKESLVKNRITHVVDWSNTARCNVFDNLQYLCISNIRGNTSLIDHMDDLIQAVDLVERVRKSGGRVLSHCWKGKNRSVTLLVAYLMKYHGMSAKEATNLIRKTRPQADPYWDALDEYSRRLDFMNVEKQESDEGLKKMIGLGVICVAIISVMLVIPITLIVRRHVRSLETIEKSTIEMELPHAHYRDDVDAVDDATENTAVV